MSARKENWQRLENRLLALAHQAVDVIEGTTARSAVNPTVRKLVEQFEEAPLDRIMTLVGHASKVQGDGGKGGASEGGGVTIQALGALYVRGLQAAQPKAIEHDPGTSRVPDKSSAWD